MLICPDADSLPSFRDAKVILEPYANLETPIVLTAWTRIDKLPSLDEQRIKEFISAYKGIDHHVAGG